MSKERKTFGFRVPDFEVEEVFAAIQCGEHTMMLDHFRNEVRVFTKGANEIYILRFKRAEGHGLFCADGAEVIVTVVKGGFAHHARVPRQIRFAHIPPSIQTFLVSECDGLKEAVYAGAV
jgi:hypothetical protein